MSQIRIRVQPNIHAALAAIASEKNLKGGLSELCGRLITSFVLDGFEFSKLDTINSKIDKLSVSVGRVESQSIAGGLTEEQDQLLRVSVRALARVTQILESAGGVK